MPKKKQITIETIEYIQRSINDLLQSNISQDTTRGYYRTR